MWFLNVCLLSANSPVCLSFCLAICICLSSPPPLPPAHKHTRAIFPFPMFSSFPRGLSTHPTSVISSSLLPLPVTPSVCFLSLKSASSLSSLSLSLSPRLFLNLLCLHQIVYLRQISNKTMSHRHSVTLGKSRRTRGIDACDRHGISEQSPTLNFPLRTLSQ